MRAQSIGYLVPPSFDGKVHSVFARACNFACGETLLSLTAEDVPVGPTTLVLAPGSAADLRSRYRVGDAIARRDDRLASPRTVVDLADAYIWRPDACPAIAERVQIEANLGRCRARLEARLPTHASVLHREARTICGEIERACSERDIDGLLVRATRLVGWGEGLTPAGDDFLVGLLAALQATRAPFARCFGHAIAARADRTTAIAAHALLLAADGHFSADLLTLRDALLSSHDFARLERLADRALDIGATSGVDRVTGLLAGISASLR